MLKKAMRGRWGAAYKELQTAVLFPTVVNAFCPQPCQAACQRKTVLAEAPVAIGKLEEACIAFAKSKAAARYVLPPKQAKVAIVGAGPVGLSCALRLAQKQFQVSIFDKNEGWGGALRKHPRFPEFDREFRMHFLSVTVSTCYNQIIDNLDALSDFDAVFVATGREGSHFGLLASLHPKLHSTSNPRVFLGGEVTGVSMITGMGDTIAASRAMEAFLLSGSPTFASETWDSGNALRYAPHDGEPQKPAVLTEDVELTEETAQREAERCMQCDCVACMHACELLVKYKKKPPRIASDVHQDGQGGRNSVSKANITRQTWSCNLCGRCGSLCAQSVDLSQVFQLSRSNGVDSGNYPPAFQEFWMREFAFMTGEAAFCGEDTGKEYAFFPGCGLGQWNPDAVAHAYAYLSKQLGAGLILNCCGIPAYWAGENEKFRTQLESLRTIWRSMGEPTLVLACASCAKTFERFLPEIPVVSLYEIMAREGICLPTRKHFSDAAVFDPCAARDKPAWKDAVRKLAGACGVLLADYDSDGKCCGFGGHMRIADPALYHSIAESRSLEEDAPYIVYCANCRDVFSREQKSCSHILELLFELDTAEAPTLEQRRENSLMLKQRMMRTYWNQDFEPASSAADTVRVVVPAEVQARMDERLITLGDVREAIARAEERKEGFINEQGDILCHLVKAYVTYWVLYRIKEENGRTTYLVLDAYSHRMHVREGSL